MRSGSFCYTLNSRTEGQASISGRHRTYKERLWPSQLVRRQVLARSSVDDGQLALPAGIQVPCSVPRLDYVARMREYNSRRDTCPPLFLAPMENLADRAFRRALASTVCGFDEACTEFIRVPGASENPQRSVRGVTRWYDACELGSVPLGAQLMGSNPELMGLAARHLVQVKGAPRVDLNCGCPANTVTGNGAGSSLLRTPDRLAAIVRAMVEAVGGAAPISVKLRAGFDDTALLEDNLLAAQEAGASFVALHPRTKRQCYQGRADWSLTARAVQLLDIPVIGNGDVVSVERAQALLRETGCHGLMVGRGAVHDPLLFLRIRHSFASPLAAAAVASAAAVRAGSGSGFGGPEPGFDPWPWREPEVVQDFLRAYARDFVPELQELEQGPRGVGGEAGSGSGSDSEAQTCGPAGWGCSEGSVSGSWSGSEEYAEEQSAGRLEAGRNAVAAGQAADSSSGLWAQSGSGQGPGGGHSRGRSQMAGYRGRGWRRGKTTVAAIKFGRIKKVMKYLFASSPGLAAGCEGALRLTPRDCSEEDLVGLLCEQVAAHWPASGGPSRLVLYDHMNNSTTELTGEELGMGLGPRGGGPVAVGDGLRAEEGLGSGVVTREAAAVAAA